MIQIFPKTVIYNVLMHMDPLLLFTLAKNSKIIYDILEKSYFWEIKLYHDYPEYIHENFKNLYKRYKRLYVGKAKRYYLLRPDDNSQSIAKTLFNFNCIRGDIIYLLSTHRGQAFVYDGSILTDDFSLFENRNEFPIRYSRY